MRTALLPLLLALAAAAGPAAAAPVVHVDADRPGVPTSATVTGVGQVFSTVNGGPPSNWDAVADAPDADAVAQARVAGVRLIGFPAGPQGARYDFKAGLGDVRATCQYAGVRSGRGLSNLYGFDEHMRFVEAVGAEAQVTIPFAFMSAADAADWVEYANAPAGANPNGGTDWAQVRAANGHPEPYGVRRWVIGGSPRRMSGRAWLAGDDRRARRQYLRGGVYRGIDEPLDGACAWNARSNGRPGQRFRARYGPVRRQGFSLSVGTDSRPWRDVRRFAGVPPSGRAYLLDRARGTVTFGDGITGAIPPYSAQVYASFRTGRLPGYRDFRAAMRAVDRSIDVCAAWDDARFVRAARRLDCLATRTYTRLSAYGGLLFNAAAYDAAMKGAAKTARRLTRLRRALRGRPGRPYLAVADYGAVDGGARLQPGALGSMLQAVHTVTQLQTFLRLGLAWSSGGLLTDDPAALLRGGGRLSPTGEMRHALGDLPGRRLVHTGVSGNPTRHGYASLRVLSARTDGGLTIVLLNRSRTEAVRARLDLRGFTPSGAGTQTQVTAEAFDSPDARYEQRATDVADGAVLELPPHSLTRLDLR